MVISGGINGIAFIGSIYKFLKYYDFDNIKDIIGVSVGSILATLLVINYSTEEIKNIFLEIKMHNFLDCKLKRFLNEWGLDDAKLHKKLLKAIFINKNYDSNITFKELYNKTNKNLIIAGTNLTHNRADFFNYKNNPNMKVIDAILISCCFPVMYTPIRYNNSLYM